jgi:hypothetical protein
LLRNKKAILMDGLFYYRFRLFIYEDGLLEDVVAVLLHVQQVQSARSITQVNCVKVGLTTLINIVSVSEKPHLLMAG